MMLYQFTSSNDYRSEFADYIYCSECLITAYLQQLVESLSLHAVVLHAV
jgi:hypothetical protein